MPYADNAGIHIHYEVEGTGPALVLHHGFTQCLEDWFERGYVTALGSRYLLILVDARGHGRSDKPHDEVSYTLDRRVTDVTSVLDAVGVEKASLPNSREPGAKRCSGRRSPARPPTGPNF